jgi:hypothetical protein
MKYNPENELTQNELNCLDEKEFFEYLDSKAQYLKQFTRPLEQNQATKFAAMGAAVEGRTLTDDEFKKAKEIGKDNANKRYEEEFEKFDKFKKGNKNLNDPDIKNVKTNRYQWFD